jgi:hypothetical protein
VQAKKTPYLKRGSGVFVMAGSFPTIEFGCDDLALGAELYTIGIDEFRLLSETAFLVDADLCSAPEGAKVARFVDADSAIVAEATLLLEG